MSDHFELSPSSANRWMVCPGSVALEKLFPREESEASREGTEAHKYAATLLNSSLQIEDLSSPEMFENARKYRSYVLGLVETPNVEEKISLHAIYPSMFGTADCWGYSEKTGFHIFDYKYGFAPVEVFENWQLLAYAVGIVGVTYSQITLHIVQPRAYHKDGIFRSWTITSDQLRDYWKELRSMAASAMSPNAPCNPSPQCGNCRACHACPALQRTTAAITDAVMLAQPDELTAAQIGHELRYLKHAEKLLEARISGISAQAESMIKRGDSVPHFRLERGIGREKWNRSVAEIEALGELMDVDLMKPKEPITPAQAVKAGIPPELVQCYAERTPGTIKLVEVDTREMKKIFGGGK